jgi:P-type Ca2+ transporter type 2C
MRSLQEICRVFPAAVETGLSADDLVRSRELFGVNRLTPLPREPVWRKFLGKFDEPIIKILLAAALLSMFVDLFQAAPALAGVALAVVGALVAAVVAAGRGSWLPALLFASAVVLFFAGLAQGHPSVEGLAVMVAVILATGVAFASEYKSDREFEVLNERKETLLVKVFREGAYHTAPMEEVLVGDVVVLEAGDEIPADGRLVKATELEVDQSLMTGESEPARKQPAPDDTSDGPEQVSCLYRGTQVVDGVGKMLVTEVGDTTYIGQIARRLSADEDEAGDDEGAAGQRIRHKLTISKELTPLQLKLKKLADLISKVGYAAAGLIFLALLVRGLFTGEVYWPRSGPDALKVAGALLNYFVYMVIVIVVAVPEGLPMSVTVSLALAMRKMTRANSLVRQLVACETIGSATIICSDKTGTMTQNRMRVETLFTDGRAGPPGKEIGDRFRSDTEPAVSFSARDWIALNAAVNSTAHLERKGDRLLTVGNTTEGALLQWLHEAGLEYEQLRLRYTPLYQVHFSSDRKRMTTVVDMNGRLVALAKGAPEWVLDNSTGYVQDNGTVRVWTPEAQQSVKAALGDAAGRAMRTLAFGQAELPADTSDDAASLHARRDALESGLIFAGFVAIRDPLRDDVKDALARCRSAGVEVMMITGDNVDTARSIAADVGLIDRRDAPIDTPDAVVLTSPEFNNRFARLRDDVVAGKEREAIASRLASLRVLARARPLDKYKMVELLQQRGQVVAVTGDGTNDAPALKKADVGLAMGIAGTEVAKEASKILLLDDSFATIVKAVHWGRSLYENIQRFLQFQLTINVSALTIAFLGPFLGVRPPFTVLQLLWINVIMDTFASIALCSEPPRDGVMHVPPKRKDEAIVTPAMARTIFLTAAFFVVVMLALLFGMEHFGWFAAGSGPEPENWEFKPLTVRQVTIFFTVYIFFQVWNQVNCRALVPEESGLSGLTKNPIFLVIAGTIAAVQVLIVSVPFLGSVFKVEPLALLDWLLIVAGTASVLVFAEAMRRLRLEWKDATPPVRADGTR